MAEKFIVPIKRKSLKGEVVEPLTVTMRFSTVTIEKAKLVKWAVDDVAAAVAQVRLHTDGQAKPLFPWERNLDDGAIDGGGA